MKKALFPLLLLISLTIAAQQKDTVKVSSTLTHATVYYGYGAELQHTAKVTLGAGLQQLVINDIALQPDVSTIQLSCPDNVTILSYQHRIYTEPVRPPKENDTLKALQKQVRNINNEYAINEDVLRRITIVIENNYTASNKGQISGPELIKLTEYYAAKVETIKNKQYQLQLKKEELLDKINAITKREGEIANASGNGPKQTGQLILQVMTANAGVAEFGISYFTTYAGWIPTYDIKVTSLDNSLKFIYKASVTQNTGLDWKRVKLSLSTRNPNQGNTLPELTADYLQLYVPQLYNKMLSGRAPGVQITTLNEVVISGYDEKKDNSQDKNTDVGNYTLVKESQLNINFEIDLPYDIPANGKAYSVAIKETSVPATFRHLAIPKLDNDAFLTAQLTQWDSLSLLPGNANVIMDNVYIGNTFIDPNTTQDTLDLSLGRDKRIALKRILIKDFTKPVIRGSNKIETFTYEITVKNNKKQPVTMTLKDQYPISKTKEIEVTVINVSDASVNEETGILTWDIKLQPGESKKFRVSYSMKYPKDKTVQTVKIN
jgi:uncharacterized protein (TIGR02231 family)